MTASLWLGFVPVGSTELVVIDESTPPGAALYARLRHFIPKENSVMATATTVPPVGRSAAGGEVIIIEDRPSVFSRVGGWFAGAFGWMRNNLTRIRNWAASRITWAVDTFHLRPLASFLKTAATSFGRVGWTSVAVGAMTTASTRRAIFGAVSWTGDHIIEYTVDFLHMVRLVRFGNWVEDRYVALRERIRAGIKWAAALGGGAVGRFFDTGGFPMRMVSSAAWTVAISKAYLMVPLPLPFRAILAVVGVVIVSGIIAEVRGRRASVRAVAPDKIVVEHLELSDGLVDKVAAKVAEATAEPTPAATASTPSKRRSYPAKRRPASGK